MKLDFPRVFLFCSTNREKLKTLNYDFSSDIRHTSLPMTLIRHLARCQSFDYLALFLPPPHPCPTPRDRYILAAQAHLPYCNFTREGRKKRRLEAGRTFSCVSFPGEGRGGGGQAPHIDP